MPSLPLVYLLIPFGLILLLAVLFFFFNVFHLKRYAIRSTSTSVLLLVYITSFAVLLIIIGIYLLTVNWNQDFQPSDLLPSFESSSRLD